MSFKENLKKIRQEKNLTIKAMAELCQVPTSTYANWETGKEPNYATLVQVAENLKISLEELIKLNDLEDKENQFNKAKFFTEHAGFEVTEESTEDSILYTDEKTVVVIKPKDLQVGFLQYGCPKEKFTKIILDIINKQEQLTESMITDQISTCFAFLTNMENIRKD